MQTCESISNQPLNLFYFLIFIISFIIIYFVFFRDSLKMETKISENLQ
jgi:hypothetical protein